MLFTLSSRTRAQEPSHQHPKNVTLSSTWVLTITGIVALHSPNGIGGSVRLLHLTQAATPLFGRQFPQEAQTNKGL
jgi:hypothetical protein